MTDAHSHFGSVEGGTPTAAGRFVDVATLSGDELLPGLVFRPVLGERMLGNFVHFAPGTEAPRHAHEEEQMVIVLDGELHFDLDGEVRLLRKGDVVVIPAWVPHGAWTTDQSCYEVDVFTPPRKTLLAQADSHR